MMKTVHALAAVIAIVLAGCTTQRATNDTAQANEVPVAESTEKSCRQPARAGMFYPADPKELATAVDGYLGEKAGLLLEGHIIGLMAPHAGYEFSGATAGAAYAALEGREYDIIVILGPSHRGVPLTGAALSGHETWKTPLGEVAVNREFNQKLKDRCSRFSFNDRAHAGEHSIEVQLPFLQRVLDDFSIVPIVFSDFEPSNVDPIAQAIAAVAGDTKTLIVASTDMSHYPPAQQAREVDRAILETICTMEPQAVREKNAELLSSDYDNLHCTLCGLGPVIACMKASRALGAKYAGDLDYTNSAEADVRTVGRCVGYGAVIFHGTRKAIAEEEETKDQPEFRLDQDQQAYLLELARLTIANELGAECALPATDDPMMHEKRAVFVTLKKDAKLRGCIGQIIAEQPLAAAVQDAAFSAATRDHRFVPMTNRELDDIQIEISVLSPMEPVEHYDNIEVGKHGVLVRQGRQTGVFLPQVAPEQGWDRQQMLSNLCAHKAGLAPDAYKDPETELYVFTAQVFHEEEEDSTDQ